MGTATTIIEKMYQQKPKNLIVTYLMGNKCRNLQQIYMEARGTKTAE